MRNTLIAIVYGILLAGLIIQSCQSEHELNYARYYTNGKSIYEEHCLNCHGKNGEGLAKLYPPLTDTIFLKNNKSSLSCIIRNGLQDTIKIAGIEFAGKMPSESHLADIDIAAVITYITNSFGNKQGLYDVANARADLKNCRNQDENK